MPAQACAAARLTGPRKRCGRDRGGNIESEARVPPWVACRAIRDKWAGVSIIKRGPMQMKDHPAAVSASDVPPRSKPSNYPEPFASRMAGRIKRPLGDVFGLKNFGVNLYGAGFDVPRGRVPPREPDVLPIGLRPDRARRGPERSGEAERRRAPPVCCASARNRVKAVET